MVTYFSVVCVTSRTLHRSLLTLSTCDKERLLLIKSLLEGRCFVFSVDLFHWDVCISSCFYSADESALYFQMSLFWEFTVALRLWLVFLSFFVVSWWIHNKLQLTTAATGRNSFVSKCSPNSFVSSVGTVLWEIVGTALCQDVGTAFCEM